MKKANVHYRQEFKRQNNLRLNLVEFFISICSFPKLFLEVFLRRKFGQRYFNLGSALGVTIIMFALPYVIHLAGSAYGYFMNRSYGFELGSFLLHYLSWYVLLAAFVVRSIKHRLAMRLVTGEFDWEWYSQSSGIIHPFFYEFELNGWKASERQVEIFMEPAIPFIAGIFLMLISQPIGAVLIICSIIYSASYAAAYYRGDSEMYNWIDMNIVAKNKEKLFLDDPKIEETNGVRLRAKRPIGFARRSDIYEEAIKDIDDIGGVV